MHARSETAANSEREILGAAASIGVGGDLSATLNAIAMAARGALGADRASCYVIGPRGTIQAVHTTEADPRRRAFLEAGVGLGPERVPIWRVLHSQGDPLLVVEDTGSDPRLPAGLGARLEAGAFVGIRLEHRSIETDHTPDLLGTLFFTFRAARRISPEERAAARGLAGLATLALANARLQAETAERAAEQAALRRVATYVAAEAEPAVVFRQVAEEVAGLLGVECGLVLQYGASDATPMGWWGAGSRTLHAVFPLVGEGALARVAQTEEPARVDDYATLADDPAGQFARSGGYRSAVAAPVRVNGCVWGALLAASVEKTSIEAGAEARLEHFAELMALTIVNTEARTRLAAQAATDPLTGLANHRAFFERLHAESSRARRDGRSLSLVLLDLDHFKHVNDTCGHMVGDRVLTEVARRLTASARQEDVLARVGGEEFAWLLPDADGEFAWAAAERARRAVADTEFPEAGPLTISAGISELAGETTINEFFRAADLALYWAKSQGRNVCVPHTSDHGRVLSAQPLAGGGRLTPTVDRLLALAREQLGLTLAAVGEFEDDVEIFRHLDGDAAPFGLRVGTEVPLEETYCHWVAQGRLPQVIRDTRHEEAARPLSSTAAAGTVGAYVGVPITLPSGTLYGMLCCLSPQEEPGLGEGDARLLRILASMIGEELERTSRASRARDHQREGIRRVLDGNGLSIVLQPIVELAGGRVVAAEALSRFAGEPSRGPDVWFAEASVVGLERELELAAVGAALACIDQVPPGARLSINASPSALLTAELSDLLATVPGERLALELTEHAPVSDYASLEAALARIRGKGVWLMVDDAGAGFSSLKHILGLHPDVIKLDVSLSRDIDTDPVRRALAASLVGFAREIGALIVAEGIETAHELDTLRGLGVTHGQGYHLARPSPGPVPSRIAGAAGLHSPRAAAIRTGG